VNGIVVLKPELLRTSLSGIAPHWTRTPSTKYSSVNGGTCLTMPVLGLQKGGSHVICSHSFVKWISSSVVSFVNSDTIKSIGWFSRILRLMSPLVQTIAVGWAHASIRKVLHQFTNCLGFLSFSIPTLCTFYVSYLHMSSPTVEPLFWIW